MELETIRIDKINRFALKKEKKTGQYILSFPVFNGMAEYSEYYRIETEEYMAFSKNESLLLDFVEKCKTRQMDSRLIEKPGRPRGEP